MINVQEALNTILQNTLQLGTEIVSLESSLGRVLREEISADRDFPPFDRVTMDGIAISYETFGKGQRVFKIEGRHMAGAPNISLQSTVNCLEVMTGAILPKGTDAVIRYEDVEIEEDQATIQIEEINHRQNIHRKGTDRKVHDTLITSGTLITPSEIGVMATVGKAEVAVSCIPKIAIISTGDELINVDQKPAAHQIRKSNVYSLQSALTNYCCRAGMFHIADNREETIKQIGVISEEYDVLMLSGGVSKGKADYVPEALEELGFEKLLHRIKQRPGKPFWFGSGKDSNKVVFAFPGNPVSTFLCYQKYFRPWMEKSLGLPAQKPVFACLAANFYFKPDLTYFLQVETSFDSTTGQLMAKPIEGHGSGDLANLLYTDAFLELPDDRSEFKVGEVFPTTSFK